MHPLDLVSRVAAGLAGGVPALILLVLSVAPACTAADTTARAPVHVSEPGAVGASNARVSVAPGPVPGPAPVVAATPIADEYRDVAGRIIEAAMADDGAYEKLAFLTDRIGHRLSGSRSLERAVAWATATMTAEGHDNVHTEKVMVPHWVRGQESAEILAPTAHELHILGLGMSVGTGPKGIEAEVLVIDDFDELEAKADQVKGRIVLYNAKMPAFDPELGSGYGTAVVYRARGPSRAAKLGAKAVLVRSVTATSLRTPHTGGLRYSEDAPRIPAAAVTTEDAELLARLAASGERVRVRLHLGAKLLPDAESANVVAELRGRELPDEIVLIGGHLDSWDVGQGAHDDGGGCVTMMHAITLLRRLNLRPRRTIRVVLFTNEENGLGGGRAYFRAHEAEVGQHVVALESDTGVFQPIGFRIEGGDAVFAHMRDIVTLLEPMGATRTEAGEAGADVMFLTEAGVPGLGLWPDIAHYFDYHHTDADTLDKIDPEHLKQNVAVAAVAAYVIADMPQRFGQAPAAAEPTASGAGPDATPGTAPDTASVPKSE